jgi:3'-phosphoadenosine 5'-phosphosulfate sulfotransferase (PAPS reductase)/FAD synthetase
MHRRLEEKVVEAIDFIREQCRGSTVVVLFSGGKDSLTSLHLSVEAYKGGCKVFALHADTTIGIPDNTKYVEEVCRRLGVKLFIARPHIDYFTLAMRWGFPRMKYRWCCRYLKIYPIKRKLEEIEGGNPKVVVDGIRAQESKARKKLERVSFHRIWKVKVVHPILYWSKEEVEEYIELYLKPIGIDINPLYKKGFKRACECWCPTFKRKEDFVILAKQYPDFFLKLSELESKARSKFAYAYIGGKPLYLCKLAEELGLINPHSVHGEGIQAT